MTPAEIQSTVDGLRLARTVALVVGPIAATFAAAVTTPVEHDWFLVILVGAALLGYAVAWLSAAPLRGLAAVVVLLDRIASRP